MCIIELLYLVSILVRYQANSSNYPVQWILEPDYDTKTGAKALNDALSFHDSNLENYEKIAKRIIDRYSPNNEQVRKKYKDLFE